MAGAADAPPANDNDMPTIPIAGTASFRRFRFEACLVWGIDEASHAILRKMIATFARNTVRRPYPGDLQGQFRFVRLAGAPGKAHRARWPGIAKRTGGVLEFRSKNAR
jgi:hypothetical protein